jgi:multidrug efflux system membrane fusion protein
VKADRAAVESARAQLKVQQSAVDAARLQLGYTVVRSPIDGRTGDLTVKPGNLVAANTTQLMTVVQVEPIFVTFLGARRPSGHDQTRGRGSPGH